MKILVIALLGLAAPTPPRPLCRDAAQCASVARQALQGGQLDRASRAATLQLHYGECSQEAEVDLGTAIDTLATTELKRGAPLMAQAWVEVDAEEHPKIPDATRARVAAAAGRLAAAPSAAGSYRKYQRAGLWDRLDVRPIDAEHIQFSLAALRLSGKWCDKIETTAAGDLSVAVAALGNLDGEATLQGDKFVYETREFMTQEEWSKPCILRFRFDADALSLTQDGTFHDCGFGYGVNASGNYVRTSRKPPVIKKRPSPPPSPSPST